MPTLEWIGKDKVINHHQEVPFRVLERKYSFDENGQTDADNGSENMIIRGDNLEALKALLPRYEGRVKCIYIDPPYNTGNEGWVYNDNVNDPKIKKWLGEVVGKEGEDLTRHDKWLCMMYPRLKLLQKLLHPTDGSIFISIDENEIQNLKLICNEVFGANNHVATIAWQKRYSRENRGAIGDAHEYILVYASDVEVFKMIRHKVEFDEESAKVYKNPNNDPKGRWRAVPMTAQGYRPNQMYPITTPSGKICYPPQGRCWSTIEPEYKKLLEAGRIYFGKNGDSQPSTIRYLSEVEGMVPWTWWPHDEVGHTDEAKKEIISILGDADSFDTPKPTRLLKRVLQIASDPDSIILDSFAGSGTTAHAVLNMNKADGGNRKFILIEMMDYADSITAERVKRVIDGYGEGKNAVEGTGGNFSFYDLGEPLMIGECLNERVAPEKIREYIWFMETRTPFNSEFGMRNSELRMHNSECVTHNSECGSLNSEFGMRNSEFGIQNAKCGSLNSECVIRNSELDGTEQFRSLNSEFGMRNSECMTHNSECAIHNSGLDGTEQFRSLNSEFGMRNSECMTHNSECGSLNSECGSLNSECAIHNSECAIHNSELDGTEQFRSLNSEFEMRNAELDGTEQFRSLNSECMTHNSECGSLNSECAIHNSELDGTEQFRITNSEFRINNYFLGRHNHTDYYFYYEPQRVTVLDYAFLATITEKADGTVIYADRCAISEDKLSQMGITFKKIPRDISKL